MANASTLHPSHPLAAPDLRALRTRAALQADTLLTADELGAVLPVELHAWVRGQVPPCAIIDGVALYPWGDVQAALTHAPRPRGARRSSGVPPAGDGHLTLKEAAAVLGVAERTLRRRLEDPAVAGAEGGPVDVSVGRYHHWRFPAATLDAWWRAVLAVDAPARPAPRLRRRRAPDAAERRVDWAAEARGPS